MHTFRAYGLASVPRGPSWPNKEQWSLAFCTEVHRAPGARAGARRIWCRVQCKKGRTPYVFVIVWSSPLGLARLVHGPVL
ncbi:hypothetical protein HF521_022572 [Silurus meridionalis]|uniref:Uncharacterized protein n=1 Tax=Silurus meridionalis TaxID=175797 RepID=A0A8T0B9U1_SILME|nr:hypothetical protein HF521_022572 [Silurus meridionalis]